MPIFQALLNGLAQGAMIALVALGYTMVYGILKLINFAHSEVFMVGAYAGFYVLTKVAPGLPPVAALVVTCVGAMVVSTLTGITVERIAYRPIMSRPGGGKAAGSRITPLVTALGMSVLLQNLTVLVIDARPLQAAVGQQHRVGGGGAREVRLSQHARAERAGAAAGAHVAAGVVGLRDAAVLHRAARGGDRVGQRRSADGLQALRRVARAEEFELPQIGLVGQQAVARGPARQLRRDDRARGQRTLAAVGVDVARRVVGDADAAGREFAAAVAARDQGAVGAGHAADGVDEALDLVVQHVDARAEELAQLYPQALSVECNGLVFPRQFLPSGNPGSPENPKGRQSQEKIPPEEMDRYSRKEKHDAKAPPPQGPAIMRCCGWHGMSNLQRLHFQYALLCR